jgi:hypothetical protein
VARYRFIRRLRAERGMALAKTSRYSMSQGQQGIRPSGGGIDIDSLIECSQPTTIASGSFPFEVEWCRFPLLYPQDATVSTLQDANPLAEPAYNYQLQEVALALNAAFTAAAASWQLLVRLWRAGVLIGTVATFDASVTTFAAHTAVLVTSGFGFNKFQPGDILTWRVVINGAGASLPPFLLTVDGQV